MILETGDLHLNANRRDAYRHTFMEQTLPELLRKYHVDTLIVLGDICDEKDRHPAWLANKVVDYFHALTKKVIAIYILKGNHDYVDVDNPFYQFLRHIPRVHWINRPGYTLFEDKRVLLLPHTRNPKRDWQAAWPNIPKYDRIYAHQTFAGAAVGARKLEGISLGLLPDVPIISGDVHVPQSFENVTYVGAPYLCNFGDDYKPRVLLRDGSKVKSIPVPGVQKRLVEISSVKELDRQRMLNAGDILKVRVELKPEGHARWPEIKAAVENWSVENGYQLHLVQPHVLQPTGKATARRRDNPSRTDTQFMQLYAQGRATNEETLKVGLDIMRKV